MEEFFNITIEDFLYQKFLLEICKICDDIYFSEGKTIEIPFDEKERMAEEMLRFVVYSLKNLKGSLIKVKKKPKNFKKKIKKFSEILSEKAEKDRFTKFVLLNYILGRKVRVKKVPSNLTLGVFVLLTKGKKIDLKNFEKKVRKVRPFTIRVAALISPFIELYKKLQREAKKGNIQLESVLREGRIDKETLKYIG